MKMNIMDNIRIGMWILISIGMLLSVSMLVYESVNNLGIGPIENVNDKVELNNKFKFDENGFDEILCYVAVIACLVILIRIMIMYIKNDNT